ncbi:SRPBCC family protein [Paenibacillus senegalensis]|uniref:SRPBCC family protein n=1 Tax=Paenibacillus senegalensis TaxID=1465766 RepID=UPI0002881BC1|nr:SRPBCC family protein [Paenibacillus senegalensis]
MHDEKEFAGEQTTVTVNMLIRRPVQEVYEAFINPEITTKFWFTRSSGRLEKGKIIRWDWEMYGAGDDLEVLELEENKRILIEFASDRTTVEWLFSPRNDNATYVTIVNKGFNGSPEEMMQQAIDAKGGYMIVVSGLKALLEHGIRLNLVADQFPDDHVRSCL